MYFFLSELPNYKPRTAWKSDRFRPTSKGKAGKKCDLKAPKVLRQFFCIIFSHWEKIYFPERCWRKLDKRCVWILTLLKVNCVWNLEKGTVEHVRTNFPLIFSAQTPALHWQTEYSHDFRGARGRPTTTERYCQDVDYFVNYPYIFIVSSRSNNGSLVHFFLSPWDMSWSNLNMWHALCARIAPRSPEYDVWTSQSKLRIHLESLKVELFAFCFLWVILWYNVVTAKFAEVLWKIQPQA